MMASNPSHQRQTTARGGYRYAITSGDDFSSSIVIYFLTEKCGASAALEKMLADTPSFGNVKILRCDNGGEFVSSEMINLTNSIILMI